MGRPRQVTDEEILEAARACFLEQGASASTATIAERLGVSHGVLFQRFKTKEELLKAALLPPEPAWIAELDASGVDARPIREQLAELAGRISDELRVTVPRIAILRAHGFGPKDLCLRGGEPVPLKAHRAVATWLRRALEAGRIRACDPDEVAYILLGALLIRPFHRHAFGGRSSAAQDATYASTVVDLLWRSLDPGSTRVSRSSR